MFCRSELRNAEKAGKGTKNIRYLHEAKEQVLISGKEPKRQTKKLKESI